MAQLDTITEYARERLETWGDEFRINRPLPMLGHASKNMLQIAVDHKGEMPPPNVGFKPEEVDLEAMEIEDMVRELFHECARVACVLRAYYCGSGRKGVERLELARTLTAQINGNGVPMALSRRVFYQTHELGLALISGMLLAKARGNRQA